MRRRQFLHVAGAAATAPLAGCASLPGRTTELHSPTRTDEEDGAYWTFREDDDPTAPEGDDRLLNAGIRYGDPFESGLVPLRFHTWHRGDTHLESLRIALRFGRPAGGVPPDVYLDTFDSDPDPTIEFRDDVDRGATILDVLDLGPVGRGSLGLSFLVRPHGWLPDELGVGIRGVLTVEGALSRRYVTVVEDRIPFVGSQ